MWFRKTRSKRNSRKFNNKPTLERLEDRTVPTATWNNFGGDAQHTDVAQVAAQPINHLLWQMPLDMTPWGYVHYGDPIFTPNNLVVVPLKVTWDANNQNATNFIEVGMNDVTGAVLWSTAPMGSITGAQNVGNSIVITTNNTNGLANGNAVTVGDMQGDTAANAGSNNTTYHISNVTPTSFTLDGVTGNGTYTGGGLWMLGTTSSASTSYIEPAYSWLPPDQAAYDPVTDRVYFPGSGGTIDYVSNPDTATGVVTPVQEAFYGMSNYNSNPAAYDASIYINTPLTVDTQGNVYFGYAINGSNPSSITKGGIARISSSGTAANVTAFAAADTAGQTPSDDGNWVAALGSAPALSNDGSTVYFAVDDGGYSLGGGESNAYLVGLNTSTFQPEYSVRLFDPTTGSGVPATGVQTSGNGAGVIDQSTASPMVAPDGTIYMGVFGSNYDGSRGSLLHYSGNLQTEYTPGAFGWDDTASVVPTSMVPSYTGSSQYLILSKFNNYANAETGSSGGNGVNEIAVLDPYASEPDPNNDPEPNGQPMPVMKQILAIASPSPDIGNINGGDPDAVREWCTNGTAIDPLDDSIFVNNEDGYTYEWNLGTDTITNTVEVSQGYGVPYTPTAISPNGEVFSDNGGVLFSLGGYSNYSLTTVSSANPAVYGTPFTLTTTLAATSGGPTPTGTITYTAYAGANNPLNYNTTPISLGSATINAGGVATLTISGTQLPSAHYHIIASYSGETNEYTPGQATIALPILETATTTVSASPNPVAKGTSVTFTATVTPNGTPITMVQNGTSSSSYFVPIGTVTFMDGSTVLGTVNLNPLETGGPNGNGTYPSTYTQQVTFTTSKFSLGNNPITAVYSGDQNFAGGTSTVYNETVAYIVTSTADDGSTGTLRDAINQVNAGNYNEIVFEIGTLGSSQTISFNRQLPALTANGVYINGLSQGGSGNTKPLITLDGTNVGTGGSGFQLQGSNCTLSGFIIEHFSTGVTDTGSNNTIGGTAGGAANIISGNKQYGVFIISASGVQVQGNYLGTDPTGTTALGNGEGVEVEGSNNTIGGTAAGARNIISGNTDSGVQIEGNVTGIAVQGNYIGTDVTGTKAIENNYYGVDLAGPNNTIGGTATGAGNVISGNGSYGVLLQSSGSTVQGNYIGTDLTGTKAIANVWGINVGGSNSTIGGTATGAGNVISGNDYGVYIEGAVSGVSVQGNYIGTDVTGATALGSMGFGIDEQGLTNTIGGTATGAGNVISGNSTGLLIGSSVTGDVVQGNYIGTEKTGAKAVGNSVGIEVDGSANTIGGTATGAGNVISGNSNDGVYIYTSATGVSVQGNYIGTDVTGTKSLPNSIGVSVAGAGNIIGGTATGSRNIISGNSAYGVWIDASGVTVVGNYIGTDITGAKAVPNSYGIEAGYSNITIGGTGAAARNIISGNSKSGVDIDATAVTVQGNYIGTDVTGTTAVANSVGVIVSVANTLGGTATGAGNVISGNSTDGVLLNGNVTSGVSVLGNSIGTNAAGNAALANSIGIEVAGTNETIGGITNGAGNTISGNSTDGVLIDSSATGVQVLGLDILSNSVGIEIAGAKNTLGGTASGSRNIISANSNDGVLLDGSASGNVVLGNYIGLSAGGTSAVGNSVGIEDAGSGNTIGGSVSGAGNYISGNSGDGVLLDSGAKGEAVQGDFIGLTGKGTAALANGSNGIEIQGTNNTIGGTAYFDRNFISGNGNDGVLIDSAASGNVLQSDFIGLDTSGTHGVGNVANGVEVAGSSNTIGGTVSGATNYESGNTKDGILLDSTASSNVVADNWVGTDKTGKVGVANSGNGIEVMGAGNTLGGVAGYARNIVAGNSGDGVHIDSGASGTLLQGNYIGLNYSAVALGNSGNGVNIAGNSNTIGGTASGARNFISSNSKDGVLISAGSGNLVQGDDIGTDATGSKGVGNVGNGVEILGNGNTLGGTSSAALNIIAGNSGDGVRIDSGASGDVVLGNFIGVNASAAALANSGYGVDLFGTKDTIGGTVTGSRNIIAGNGSGGMVFQSTASANLAQSNFVGLNGPGNAVGNTGDGVLFLGTNNTIGGTASAARNVISANSNDGVQLGSGSSGNVVLGNYIGLNISGTAALGNSVGIEDGGSSNTIGGTSGIDRNYISGNSKDGILLDSGAKGEMVQGNYIGLNVGGTSAVGNSVGIEDAGSGNTIGGSVSGAGNYISGNSGDGVLLDSTAKAEAVQGDFIGLTGAGTAALANGSNGVEVQGVNNTIGGTAYFDRNFISGNSNDGVLIDSAASGNILQSDFVGLDTSGTHGVGNVANGVEVAGSSNTIGGSVAGATNYESGNTKDGILLDSTASSNVVADNWVGTDKTGKVGVANSGNGVEIMGASNTLGGSAGYARNIISGNSGDGVVLDSGASGTLVQGNYIGVNYSAAALGNSGNGVNVSSNNNTIGGTVGGAGNVVSGNGKIGVLIAAGSGTTISRNSIYSNTGQGISLSSGANNNIVAPSLSSATLNGSTLTVKGSFTAATANVSYVLEFFANLSGDPEGRVYLGSMTVKPTSTGTVNFTYNTTNSSQLGTYPLITTTLTDSTGDTSAFSSGITA